MTVAATITDEFIDGYIRSVFQTLTDKVTDDTFPSVTHDITDGIKSVGIFQAGNFFFWRANFVCKAIDKWFFCVFDWYSDGMWNYRWKESRRTYFIGEDIDKYITDETLITDRQNMSVGKTVKFCSVYIYIPKKISFQALFGVTMGWHVTMTSFSYYLFSPFGT